MAALFQKKNTLLDTAAPEYLQKCLVKLGDPKIKTAIKGKFPGISYTLSGYDISPLSYSEKVDLTSILFHLYVDSAGEREAVKALQDLLVSVRDRLGAVKDFENLILDLPSGVFAQERVKYLSKGELEENYSATLKEITNMREALDKGTSERTLALAAEKDILEATLYNTSDGVFALDREGKIVTFNKAMEELTGYIYSEVVKKPADDIVRLFDDSMPLDSGKYSPVLDTIGDRNVYSNTKVTLVTKSGQKKFVRMVSAVISEGKDINLGCIVTLTDITKEIELETLKLDFVSIAAHELRTPLTSIRGYLSLLGTDAVPELSEVNQEYLKKVIVSADQLYILTENLLNISRIERGSLILQKTVEEWLPVVKSVVERFTGSADESGVKIQFIESKTTLPKVYIDRTMVTEVISNLLDNAIKYNNPGGRVSIFIEELDGFVVTHIKDTGIGIPPESMPHLFKKFYRTSTSIWKQGRKGTGLGLFISSEIVRLHGGKIWAESHEKDGSTFSFTIPTAQVAAK